MVAQYDYPDLQRFIAPGLILIAAVLVLYIIIAVIRRRLRRQEDPSRAGGFSLADLRRLKKEGALTDEEFEKAKGKIVEAATRALERDTAARAAEAAARAAKDR